MPIAFPSLVFMAIATSSKSSSSNSHRSAEQLGDGSGNCAQNGSTYEHDRKRWENGQLDETIPSLLSEFQNQLVSKTPGNYP